jgi:hypothetical protein
MSKPEQSTDIGDQAMKIFQKSRTTTAALRMQLDEIEPALKGEELQQTLGQFIMENIDVASVITDLARPDNLKPLLQRYAVAAVSRMMIKEAWEQAVRKYNDDLREILEGKKVKATLIPGVHGLSAIGVLFGGGTAYTEIPYSEVTGEVISADSNLSDLFLRSNDATEVASLGSVKPLGWHVHVFDSEGQQRVDLASVD